MQIINIIDEINTLIKKYAPRPYFTNQEHLGDIIQNESLAEVRADFVMDEWVIGHITEIIEKYQEPKTGHWISDAIQGEIDGQIVKGFTCSECGAISVFRTIDGKIVNGDLCPNCGAKMESEE